MSADTLSHVAQGWIVGYTMGLLVAVLIVRKFQ